MAALVLPVVGVSMLALSLSPSAPTSEAETVWEYTLEIIPKFPGVLITRGYHPFNAFTSKIIGLATVVLKGVSIQMSMKTVYHVVAINNLHAQQLTNVNF